MHQVHYRNACRLCGSSRVREFIRFERMPFTDEFVRKDRLGSEFLADIAVYWCEECRSSQTQHDVEVGEYYRDYQYTVSSSPFAQRFMRRLAEESFKRFGFGKGDRVIEIGSGDGFQLSCFRDLGARVLGFEPSAELTRVARKEGIETVQALFDEKSAGLVPSEMRPAQVVLLTYTFDHLPEPRPFLELLRTLLDPQRGIVLIEIHDLAKIVERREICLFEHEHSIYLTALTLNRLLERCGFELVSDTLLPDAARRGNSLLVAAAPRGHTHRNADYRPRPGDAALEEWETYQRFGNEVWQGIERLRGHLAAQRAAGRRVAGYGAGGRGVMTLAMAGLTRAEIAYLADQNPSFHGLFTPATHIPVVSPEHIRSEPVDELVVFSYAYLEEIRARVGSWAGKYTSILELM